MPKAVSHDRYRTRDIGGRYADLARARGRWSERVERPEAIAGAFARGLTGPGDGRGTSFPGRPEPPPSWGTPHTRAASRSRNDRFLCRGLKP
jgi:hypothetical protein